MATAINAHIGVGGSATGLTSGSVSPSGDDRYMFGVACGLSADPTAFKYGGSGGTDLTQIGSDTAFGVFYTCNFWDIDPGPTGSTTAYATYSATGSNALSAVFCTGVDQTTPTEALQTASGENDGIDDEDVASITVTGLVSGQVVVVGLAIGILGETTISSVVAGANTTVQRSDFGTQSGERQSGTAILTGTASGTSLTLSATITVSGLFSTFYWELGARPTLEASAAGSTGTVAYTNAADTSTASGTTTVTGTLARTNTADTSAASGTTTVTGTLARTNANDTSAAAGTTSIVGSLATTNANDTLAASGEIGEAISGTLATTNANDTSAASGTTTVTGSLARTNANDTSAAAGTTTVVGTLAYTNADDTVSASGTAGTPTGTVNYTNNNDTASAQGETPRQTTGAPGGRPWIAYINGRRVSGSLWELQRLIEELAEDQAEKAVEQGEEPKKPRIVIQPGKAVSNMPAVTQEQGRALQAEIRSSYNEAYTKAKIKLAEQEEEEATMMVLLS